MKQRHYLKIENLPHISYFLQVQSSRLPAEEDYYRIVLNHNSVYVERSVVDDINSMGDRNWYHIENRSEIYSVVERALVSLIGVLMSADNWKHDSVQVIWTGEGVNALNAGKPSLRAVLGDNDIVIEKQLTNTMDEKYWHPLVVEDMDAYVGLVSAYKEVIQWCADDGIEI